MPVHSSHSATVPVTAKASGATLRYSAPNLQCTRSQGSKGEPSSQTFMDETSQPGSRLFGQGAEFRIGTYRVSSTLVGALEPAPSEPTPIESSLDDGMDGTPTYEPIP